MASASPRAEELRTRGYTILPEVYSAEHVQALRATLESIYTELCSPPLSVRGMVDLGEGATMSGSGLQIGSLVTRAPDIVPFLFHEELRQAIRAVLGEELRVEGVIGKVSDSTRQMHPWHHHIGGPDEALVGPDYPHADHGIARLTVLVYLQDIGAGAGELMLYPRSLADPVEAPGPLREPWEGEVRPRFGAGTAVVLDERTWHAASPRTRPGLRMYVGAQVVPRHAPVAHNTDRALEAYERTLLGH